MALVAYDASDSETGSDEDLPAGGGVELVEKSSSNESSHLFQNLPDPRAANKFTDVVEENDEFLLKKEQPTEKPVKKPIRIVVPSLEDFSSDDEEPTKKRTKIFSKSSGLFSILPPPKLATVTTKSMIPHSVTKKAKKQMKPMLPRSVHRRQISTAKEVNLAGTAASDDEDDVAVEEFDINTWKAVCGRKAKPEPIVEVRDYSQQADVATIDAAPEPNVPYEGLDNAAFKKLVGSSKIRPENIRLIDVNEEQVMTDEDILRAKALTDPEVERSASKEEEPISAMSKRKHHITYLAQQAKANEQELKNRWASNRFSRKQTQAKYGF